ncbi:hypothetical protein [Cellulomonas sp. Marseille-Q8402]
MRAPLSRAQVAALDRSISATRMATYLRVARGDAAWARALYLWDRELAAAFLADVALLEVALRNAMNGRLVERWGPEWYSRTDVGLDDRASRQLAQAYGQVVGPKLPGRIVAQCTFGFWVGLLDKGDHHGAEPRRVRCDYDQLLWRGVLDRAFPGGRAVARADGARWGRAFAHQVAARVNVLRNRMAHHEPLIDGYPLTGRRRDDGVVVRSTARDGFADLVRLAAMLDRDLHALVLRTSRVPDLLGRRPRARDARPARPRHGPSSRRWERVRQRARRS